MVFDVHGGAVAIPPQAAQARDSGAGHRTQFPEAGNEPKVWALTMALPVDPKITELRALYERAATAHKATQDAEHEARRKEDDTRQKLYDFIRELGYCPHCELPFNECRGHGQIIDRRREDRRRN